MRSYAQLLEASGYAGRPSDFDTLLRILDNETRLITPTDPEGCEEENPSASQLQRGQKYYQLTHDYLVVSVRDWLARKQKETRRGRAELLLADRAEVWNARPENRQLPSLFQWLRIRWLTQKKTWTPPPRKMMLKALRYHLSRGSGVVLVFVMLAWIGYEEHGKMRAAALRDELLNADTTLVLPIIKEMDHYRSWIDPRLRQAYQAAEANHDARKQLHFSLALLPVDASLVQYVYGRLFDAEPSEVPVILKALAPRRQELVGLLWGVVESPEKGKESQRLRAAASLAMYDPKSDRMGPGAGGRCQRSDPGASRRFVLVDGPATSRADQAFAAIVSGIPRC